MRDQRSDEIGGGFEYVQERAPGRRPAARREHVLLAVDRCVIGVLGDHDLSRHARAVPVPLDQARGAGRLDDSALRRLRAGELRDAGPPHDQLGRHDLERLLPVVADHLPLAVRRAGLLVFRQFEDHLVAGKVGGHLFVPGLGGCLLATLVSLDRLQGRVGDALGRVHHVRRVAEVENELFRIGQVSLDLLAERQLQGGVTLLLELRDLLHQVVDHRVARGEIVRKHDFLRHARNIDSSNGSRKCFFRSRENFFRRWPAGTACGV